MNDISDHAERRSAFPPSSNDHYFYNVKTNYILSQGR